MPYGTPHMNVLTVMFAAMLGVLAIMAVLAGISHVLGLP